MWARINLIPLLQAEEDRDQVRRYWADQAREKALLGENMKVYNNEKYVSLPCFASILIRALFWDDLFADMVQVRPSDTGSRSRGDEIDTANS
jgi:hypothetical protein